jgi:hypothetical protein
LEAVVELLSLEKVNIYLSLVAAVVAVFMFPAAAVVVAIELIMEAQKLH